MTILDDIISYIGGIRLWGRSGWDYTIAAGLFLGLMVFFYIIRFIVIGRFQTYLKSRDDMDRVKVLVKGVKRVLSFRVVFLLSLYLSILTLEPDEFISEGLRFLLLFVIAYFLTQFSFLLVDYLIEFRSKISTDSTNILEFFRLVLKTALFLIIALWFLSSLGVETDVFIASIGVFSLAIAFSLQNVITDVFAALTIYLDRPIEIGDTIAIGGEIATVEKIGIRSTRLRTLTGHMLIVSNREIISTRIHNYQKMERRRIPFVLNVHYNTSPSQLKEIPRLVEEVIGSVPNTKFDRAYLNNLGGSSIDFEVVYFVLSRSYSTYLETHEKVTVRLLEVLGEHNIEIPYPTQTLHIQKPSEGVN